MAPRHPTPLEPPTPEAAELRDAPIGAADPRNPRHWRWLPPMSAGGEIAARLVIGAGAAAVGVLGLGLALGAFPDLVSSDGLATGSRLLLGAIGTFFACQGLDSWADMPPHPTARWREAAREWIHRGSIVAMAAGVATAIALGFGWLA